MTTPLTLAEAMRLVALQLSASGRATMTNAEALRVGEARALVYAAALKGRNGRAAA